LAGVITSCVEQQIENVLDISINPRRTGWLPWTDPWSRGIGIHKNLRAAKL